jgi:hypothetical protein
VRLVRGLAVLLSVWLLCAGCAMAQGSPASESQWRQDTDLVLSAATSGLGSAQLLLEAQQQDRFPQPYLRVALRDVLRTMHTDSLSYLTAQPPAARERDNARAVAAVVRTLGLLERAVTAGSGEADASSRKALAAVRAEGKRIEELRTSLVSR